MENQSAENHHNVVVRSLTNLALFLPVVASLWFKEKMCTSSSARIACMSWQHLNT